MTIHFATPRGGSALFETPRAVMVPAQTRTACYGGIVRFQQRMTVTTDRAKVTCKRCIRALDIPVTHSACACRVLDHEPACPWHQLHRKEG